MNWVEKSPEGQKLHYYFDMILLFCPFQYLNYVEINIAQFAEVGIYKRKQESKKTRNKERKHELDLESDQEKKKVFSFFLVAFLVEFLFSFFFS